MHRKLSSLEILIGSFEPVYCILPWGYWHRQRYLQQHFANGSAFNAAMRMLYWGIAFIPAMCWIHSSTSQGLGLSKMIITILCEQKLIRHMLLKSRLSIRLAIISHFFMIERVEWPKFFDSLSRLSTNRKRNASIDVLSKGIIIRSIETKLHKSHSWHCVYWCDIVKMC